MQLTDVMRELDQLMKGTTTVGIKARDAVVLAADRRAVMGNLIAGKEVRKIFRVHDRVGVTTAGSVADAQKIVDLMRAEARLYRLRHGRDISARAIANVTSHVLHSSLKSFRPYLVQLIIGGFNQEEPALYNLDPSGSIIEEDYTATGSGSPTAYGVLEAEYEEDMDLEDAIEVAVRAVRSALERDTGTGEGVTVVTITRDEGYRELPEEEVESYL
ncbi:archaeal proteasome endopeptidase complex subunit beta [Methanopyrus sp.]